MTSQRAERTWIRTGGYGRLRGEWVNINGDGLPGPLIIGTFEKRAPGVVGPGFRSLARASRSKARLVSKSTIKIEAVRIHF